ncbi:MAG: prepilin-type N-terminal cleavage/methylation domain-containing protein, partial [bacterium]
MALHCSAIRRRWMGRGFTLVEIIIVGALIAIFSGIAVFSIQQIFQSNLRKVAIGEAHQIGTAVAFAKNDMGIFPKLGFLDSPKGGIVNASGALNPVAGTYFDYMSFPLTGLTSRITANYAGPYFAMSQSRQGISQGRKGIVKMHFAGDPTTEINWPADPWGNPYVLYLIKYVPATGTSVGFRFINSPTEEPDVALVVSYGQDGLPELGGNPNGRLYNVLVQGQVYELPAATDY